jgi:hypothetical protein
MRRFGLRNFFSAKQSRLPTACSINYRVFLAQDVLINDFE